MNKKRNVPQPSALITVPSARKAGQSPAPIRALIGLAGIVVMAGMLLVAMLAPAPYVIENPGPTFNVLGSVDGKKILEVEGKDPEKTSGELRMTTVAVEGSPGNSVNLAQVFAAWFNPHASVVPVEALYPKSASASSTKMMNTVEMNSSQQEAIAAALTKQGISYTNTIIVAGVREDAPANGILKPGDKVLSMDGQEKTTVADYVTLTKAHTPGNTIALKVQRGTETLNLDVPTTSLEGRTVMGIVLSPGFEFPVNVKFAVDGIGGPSAGMIFSLAIIDEMTPGDLTGGKKIAGTGTIDAAGTVGPIGGIQQKLVGAKDDGAAFFIAPADNCSEVKGHIPAGLSVVSVKTLDDALSAVHTIADTGSTKGLPTCG